VRRLIESAHDEAWEILVQYRDVLDNLVLQLMEHETLSRDQVLQIFSPIRERATRGSYTGYGKRVPSDRPPVLTPKEMALTAAADGADQPGSGNGQALGSGGSGEPNTQALGPGGPAAMGPAGTIRPIGSKGPIDGGSSPAGGYGGGGGSALGPDDGTPGSSPGDPGTSGNH
jgi:cell division protease FtsH